MILDLGNLSGMIEVTSNLSNALLVAILPYASDVAKRLELPVQQPVTLHDITEASVTPYLDSDGKWAAFGLRIKGGYGFGFSDGYLYHFQTTNSYYALQDPDEIPRLVGHVRMSHAEAVELARATLIKLGIPLEKVFAEQKPNVKLPPRTRTGIVPRYLIEWMDPRGGVSVEMEINADAKRVEMLRLGVRNPNLTRPWPEIGVAPVRKIKYPSVNPEYAWKLIPIALEAVQKYSQTLGLAIPKPLTTNQLARVKISDNGGWPHCEQELTTGWRFIYRNSMVCGFYAPDNLFDNTRRPFLIKDFVGTWNITQAEAIKLVRRALTKLGYPTNLVRMDFPPQVFTSPITNIPRYSLWWWCENETRDDLISKIEAEVDADKGELKSLYFDHKAFWGKPPPIDVPITLPTINETQASKLPRPANSEPQANIPEHTPARHKLPGQK